MQEMKAVLQKIALSVLSAILLALSFPEYDIEIFAWIGLIPLFFIIRRDSIKNTFLWCWASGTLFFFITINWLPETMHNYGGMPLWLSLVVLFVLSLYLGIYSGVFGVLSGLITNKTAIPLPFAAPLLWVSLEYARAHLLTGFPWASLGYSQYKFLHLIQIADITSVLGVSFMVVAVNAALFEVFSRGNPVRPSLSIVPISAVALMFLLSLAYGYHRIDRSYDNPERELSVAVIQGNIPQHMKWDRNFKRLTMDIYKRLTYESGKHTPDLVIWPETAAPFFFQEQSGYSKEIFDLASTEDILLLFGSPAYITADNPTPNLLNSAYLISPYRETLSRYDKIHLVPFGEYVPLSKILFFIEKMVVGIGDFIPGRDYTVMEIPQGKFGVVICYEVIFPELVRKFTVNGARFMTTITNDAWFGKSSAPYQHFSMVVFRSIENRVYFARAANTGISGFISPKGEILVSSHIFTEDYLVRKVSPSNEKTFYTLYGDVFAYASIAFTALMLIKTPTGGVKGSWGRGVK
ncbi:MAG: apolipoprotein N-acyltransferase [Nitrospirae bacterium]|nr:apolipoprotein N-acyltransferase [Nitrospirota bacterium]